MICRRGAEDRVLSDQVSERILDAVVSGRLTFGDKLPTEGELADRFGVSRTVVRDSIKILVGRGILGVKRGAGTFVRASEQYSAARLNQMLEVIPLKDSGLRDLFEVRKVLESEGACWAAQRRSSTNVEHLRRILEGAESCSENLEVVSEKDGQFHVGVAEASQNPVQVRVMYALLDLLEKARKESMKLSGRVELSLQQHFAILESIESSDGEGARLAMLAHLTSVEKDILALRRDQQY